MLDKLLIRLQTLIPARAMANAIYKLSRCRVVWIKNLLIRGFVWLFYVNTAEAELPVPSGYASFNDFFTRSLKDDVRPIDSLTTSLISPADGTIAQCGYAEAGQLLQAKGMHFSLADLLTDEALATELADSAFSTIYLAPHNYHRVHMPIEGVLEKTIFVPGLLYSVNARTTATVPNLYALNERLVCQFRGAHGRFALVLVGAMNVASMTTAWGGEILPASGGGMLRTDYGVESPTLSYSRGDYIAHFNMGSTVVFVAPTSQLEWQDSALPGRRVQMGQRLGIYNDSATP